jgi:hypothetical protein
MNALSQLILGSIRFYKKHKNMTCRFYLALIIILFHVLTINSQASNELEGSWQGIVIEEGRSNPYHVSLVINTLSLGEISGTIWYKDYNCGGDLKFLGLDNEGTFIFKELLTSNGNCINKGYVTGTLIDGLFAFVWKHDLFIHQAKGVLNRDYQ